MMQKSEITVYKKRNSAIKNALNCLILVCSETRFQKNAKGSKNAKSSSRNGKMMGL